MEWNSNNKSCVSIWAYLKSTNQLRTSFSKSEKITMSRMRFWNDLSPEATRGYAQGWADWYISYITSKDGAQFESGCNWAKTVQAMLSVMTDATKTLNDLAATVDECILFYKEAKS